MITLIIVTKVLVGLGLIVAGLFVLGSIRLSGQISKIEREDPKRQELTRLFETRSEADLKGPDAKVYARSEVRLYVV